MENVLASRKWIIYIFASKKLFVLLTTFIKFWKIIKKSIVKMCIVYLCKGTCSSNTYARLGKRLQGQDVPVQLQTSGLNFKFFLLNFKVFHPYIYGVAYVKIGHILVQKRVVANEEHKNRFNKGHATIFYKIREMFSIFLFYNEQREHVHN